MRGHVEGGAPTTGVFDILKRKNIEFTRVREVRKIKTVS